MSVRNTILIVDDHALLRDGIRALLSEASDIEIIGEASNGRDAVKAACCLHPKMVLMDISLPGINGLDAIAEIKCRFPDIKFLVVTMHKTDEHIQNALRVGASGFLIKESSHTELLAAIHALFGGKVYLSPEISERVVSSYFSGATKSISAGDTLTIREREVLKLIAEGNSNKHIAAYLCLSIKTIEKHRASLRHKLGLSKTSMLTTYAIEMGIVTPYSSGSKSEDKKS